MEKKSFVDKDQAQVPAKDFKAQDKLAKDVKAQAPVDPLDTKGDDNLPPLPHGILAVAVLNSKPSLVSAFASFGPIQVARLIWDSGCSTNLLPFPTSSSDLNELKKWVTSPGNQVVFQTGITVSSKHTSLAVTFRTPIAFSIKGIELLKLHLIRFAVTPDAAKWLRTECNVNYIGPPANLFATNLTRGLLGQTLLTSTRCYQSFGSAMAILGDDCKLTLEEMDRFLAHYKLHYVQTREWQIVKDLHEIHEDDSGELGNDLTECSFGYRLDMDLA